MTEKFFASLNLCDDVVPRSAAMNMAIDEALLESITTPSIRFYCWQSPALSFGYFGNFCDVAIYARERDLVRRWTGGGIVLHGHDLTYSIVIPSSDPAFRESSITIYEKIHRALADALNGSCGRAELVGSARCADARKPSRQRSVPTTNCFANPVRADVIIDGRKVAGAAQRRTRRSLLQQGSIQGIALNKNLAKGFAAALSGNCMQHDLDERLLHRAQELAGQKYGTDHWLRKT